VPNFDSSAAAVRLANGVCILACNPTRQRERICLAASRDGTDWQEFATLDEKGNTPEEGLDEYSYPTLLTDGDDVDLVYSYRRTGIRHVQFNAAWVMERWHE
jgi:predicted neuraminidase